MQSPAVVAAIVMAASLATVHEQDRSFEVASVRINTSGGPVTRITAPNGTGRFDATNAPLRLLILNAYRLAAFQLVGGPSWIDSLRVDIAARTEPTATRDDIAAMLRRLLNDRFELVVRRDTRELPAYALVLARGDRRLGPRLQPSTTECTAADVPGAPTPQAASGQLLCGTRISPSSLNAGGMTMTRLAATLTGIVGRQVNDETRLGGAYDLQLAFTPEQPVPGAPAAGPADSDAPSIFTAIQEQLGLRLEPTRGPVDVLVIESVQRPAPD